MVNAQWRGVMVALACAAATILLIRLPVSPDWRVPRFPLVLAAIAVSAGYGGWRAGVLTILSTIGWLAVTVGLPQRAWVSILAIYVPTAALIIYVCDRMRRQSHAAQASQVILDRILQQVADYSIYLLDASGRITHWGDGAAKSHGYSREAVIGKSLRDLCPSTGPSRDLIDHHLRVAALQGEYYGRECYTRKNGSSFEADLSLTALYEQPGGHLLGFFGISRDLTAEERWTTEIRRHEEQLAGIIDSAMDAIVSVDEQHHIVLFNRAAERMFLLSAEDAIGSHLNRLLPARLQQEYDTVIRRFRETGVTSRVVGSLSPDDQPLMALRGDGTEFPIEAAISQAQTGVGTVFTIILRDVTEVRQVAEEREHLLVQERRMRAAAESMSTQIEEANREEVRLRAEAETANYAKSQFLAMMSHELRTPLNAIGGYVQLMEMGLHGAVTEQQHTVLRRIGQNQLRLLGLINSILDYAKMEAGQMPIATENVRLSDVVPGVEASILPQAQQKRIVFVDEVCSNPDIVVRADPGKLEQVLVNLLSNAVKFTATGGLVRMSCEVRGRRALVHVSDTGIGIPADKLESIFEPFMQVPRDGTTHASIHVREDGIGTGLGLAISRDLARAMGGDITVESHVDAGSTFTVVLPLSR